MDKNFLLLAWKYSIKSIKSQQLQTTSRKVVKVESIVPLFTRIGNLHVLGWFGTFESLAIDVLLGTSVTNGGIRGIFRTEQKIIPRS